MTLSKELYGEIPYRDWNVNIDQEWQKNYKKSVENFIKAYKEHQTSGNLAYDEFNFWSMGLPDAWSKMMNAKPFSVEHWVASAELFLYIMPEAKLGSAEAKTLTKELESIVKGTGKSAADNIATGSKLNAQLTYEEASSVFTKSGTLQSEVIDNSRVLIQGSALKNTKVKNALTKNGSNINDWAKMTTETFKGPSGDFQVHFYQNLKTGEVSTFEMKVKFNK